MSHPDLRQAALRVYKAVSLQIRAIFAEYTPIIEPLSLNEAYLDVTDNLKGIVSATQIAETIRTKVRTESGLTANSSPSSPRIIVSPMASSSLHRRWDLPSSKDCRSRSSTALGTAAKMNRLGIQTGFDLREQTLAFLQQHFGKPGPYYYCFTRG